MQNLGVQETISRGKQERCTEPAASTESDRADPLHRASTSGNSYNNKQYRDEHRNSGFEKKLYNKKRRRTTTTRRRKSRNQTKRRVFSEHSFKVYGVLFDT